MLSEDLLSSCKPVWGAFDMQVSCLIVAYTPNTIQSMAYLLVIIVGNNAPHWVPQPFLLCNVFPSKDELNGTQVESTVKQST